MSEKNFEAELSSEQKEEYLKLKRARSSIKGRLTKFSDYLNSCQKLKENEITSVTCRELELKINKIQSLLSEFDDIQNKIETFDPDTERQVGERDIVENQFIFLLARGQELLDSYSIKLNKPKAESPKSSISSNGSYSNPIKLPTITLPTFDGNYLMWLEFRDTFESMVHDNEAIPHINKFHYLRAALTGSAALVIKSIEFSAQNYKIAWDLLRQRYDNKNILINNHLKSLYSINPIAKESYKSLRFIIDHVYKHLRALESLQQPVDKWDALIIYMVTTKLDFHTSRKWEEYKSNLTDLPTLEEFFTMLRGRADVLETAYNNRPDSRDHKFTPNQNKSNNKSSSHVNSLVTSNPSSKPSNNCLLCSNDVHFLYQCPKFKSMSIDDRINEVFNQKLCKNCFRSGHMATNCQLKGSCRICKLKHNSLIHRPAPSTDSNKDSSMTSTPVSLSAVHAGQVLLCTAIVKVLYGDKTHTARALLDTGSQSSFITDECKRRIGLIGTSCDLINIVGINQNNSKVVERCTLQLQSKVNNFSFNAKCLVIPKITGLLPSFEVHAKDIQLPRNVKLADPNFFRPSEIDILLGADVYWELIKPKTIKLGSGKPILQSSELGWLIAGPMANSQSVPKAVHCNFSQEIRDTLAKFWQIDDLPYATKTHSIEEKLCETHFMENVKRLSNGRFSVSMPMKEVPEKSLNDNFYIARKYLENLQRKFDKNPKLKEGYKMFLKEYADLGHLTQIDKPNFGYYIPYHAIFREKSETTKLRIVFNFSSKTSTGKSLNDIQLVGPVVQSDLISILLRFRQHKYILIGDIEKMYRQIEIDPKQRHLQLILWRENNSQAIQVLQLNTISYGTASAPFLSTRCLLQLARECEDSVISKVIESDFYVDDLNTGCDTVEDLKHIATGVVKMLDSACLPLRKFRTNCPNLFQDVTNTNASMEPLDLYKDSSVLGLNYSPTSDMLRFSTDLILDSNITKRSILSTSSKIFDPLGFLCPCVIVAKILLQRLWSSGLSWDEPVPNDFTKNWSKLLREFAILFDINIPRRVLCDNPINIELHCFVDASQSAYASCVYLRSENCDNKIFVKILCAKARVSPLKHITIPRLELLGLLLGARLSTKVLQALRCDISRKFIWTDSTVVLGWLKTSPKNLKTFVCNRVNEINELTSEFTIRHVPTDQNPADLASRGVDPKSLKESLLWWEGAPFLKCNSTAWPSQTRTQSLNLPDIKKTINCHVGVKSNLFVVDFEKFSSYSKLKGTYAYVLRFINNCKIDNTKLSASLDVTELRNAQTMLVKASQWQSFSGEITCISNKVNINKTSKLLPLTPFLDSEGVLRVGGRIVNSNFDYDKKHPIILDSNNHFTKLLMAHEHLRLFHAGPQLLLASIRDQFWPIGGRNLARSTTKRCVVCARFRAKTLQPIMGNVPAQRTVSSFPFYSCGVDMAGPFLISSRKGKGNRISKSYLCLFVCLTTKALHLELVSDLSSEAFILSLRRFVSRRGKPAVVYCDNGTNFKGANNELCRLYKSSRQSLSDFANNEGIKFMFSPAYSPHFGGIWEAGVKSAKNHLKRVASNASLTFEELTTLFAQIEAILNSRPLTPLSSDPTDPSPLTPGHFLVGRPLTSIPSPPITCKRPNRYQYIEQLRQHFWERWRREFIAELQQKTKWQTKQHELQVGDLVILKEENLPPLHWRMARISRLYPGPDGISRVADVLTNRGIIRRAINRLCLLPINDDITSLSQPKVDKPVK